MPRPLKPYVVDRVMSPNGFTYADVMFDRDRKIFFVEIVPDDVDSRVESDLLADVKVKARAALQRAQNYEWTALIEVSVDESWTSQSKNDASIVFSFRRFERSPNPSHMDRFVERKHHLDVQQDVTTKRMRDENARGMVGPYHGRDDIGPADGKHEKALLPYSDSTWDGLVAIRESIKDAFVKLEELTKRKDASHLLMIAGRTQVASAFRGVALLSTGEESVRVVPKKRIIRGR